ncbi:MAG: protein arginine kinase [Planctomycetota bacterium]|nr:MAG: protein arginine kinase [Planctomycetota bacterium]
MTLDDLINSCGEWLAVGGQFSDVVISSRIRLARNLKKYPFLSKASTKQQTEIEHKLFDAITSCNFGKNAFYVDINKSDSLDRQLLVERHLISKQHAEGQGSRGVMISGNETLALMINEEDHLRIQVLRRGMNLDDAWSEINQVDTILESAVDFAYHKQFGYLTACPTNVGTGLRVSVMLHLPALRFTNEIEKVFRAAKDMKLAVRGLYGEGTDAIGDFFQVSNQTTLGQTEEEILSSFKAVVIPSIVKYEQEARQVLIKEKPAAVDDKVWRALGMLENARAISSEEVLFLLSHLRMGVVLERVKHIDLSVINELFIATQSAHLQKRYGKKLDGEERSIARADYIRDRLGRAKPSDN